MKQRKLLYTVLFFFSLASSCKGQTKTKQIDRETKTDIPESVSESSVPTHNMTDDDQYLVETETIETPFGPKSITRDIIQDQNGNIWLASWEGIIRYDGSTFSNITNKENLRAGHIFAVLEDKKGGIWFGTIGAGVYYYDGTTFTNFTEKDGLVNNSIGCFWEDKSGSIWIGTQNGISVYNGNTFHNYTPLDGLVGKDVNSIIEDKNGLFWIGTREGASTFDGKNFTKPQGKNSPVFTNVRSIIEDGKGNIWLAGNNGLWVLSGGRYTQFAKNFTGYLHEGKTGNIWTTSVSTTPNHWDLSHYSLPYDKKNVTVVKRVDLMVFGILEDMEGRIWFGTLNGVRRYDGKRVEKFWD